MILFYICFACLGFLVVTDIVNVVRMYQLQNYSYLVDFRYIHGSLLVDLPVYIVLGLHGLVIGGLLKSNKKENITL